MPSEHDTFQPNSGSTLAHRRRLWPATIQHWTVLSVGSGVSTEYNLTPIQCLLNVGQRPVSIQSYSVLHAGGNACTYTTPQCRLNVGQSRTQWPGIGQMHVTPTHCRVNGGLV